VAAGQVFCPGCLALDGSSKGEDPGLAARVAGHPGFSQWPLIVLTDDAVRATASPMNFLWTTFTRFEPAADIHAAEVVVERNHVSYRGPVVIDARLAPGFPAELFCDADVARRVSERWSEYFPEGDVEMGDSDSGHLS
jgi:3-polyprenyl-4-hydroxybenzoate decarboxylase